MHTLTHKLNYIISLFIKFWWFSVTHATWSRFFFTLAFMVLPLPTWLVSSPAVCLTHPALTHCLSCSSTYQVHSHLIALYLWLSLHEILSWNFPMTQPTHFVHFLTQILPLQRSIPDSLPNTNLSFSFLVFFFKSLQHLKFHYTCICALTHYLCLPL